MVNERTCKFCGKQFVPNSNYQQYCKGPHLRLCPACGNQYLETNSENLKRPPHACCYKCRAVLTRKTSIKKYGVAAPGNNIQARIKSKETSLRKYGVEYAMQCPDILNKVKTTCIEKYGASNPGKNRSVIEKRIATCNERYGKTWPFNEASSYAKQHQSMQERYGVPYGVLTSQCGYANKHCRISQINKNVHDLLEAKGVSVDYELRIRNRFYDLVVPELNTVIEIDPTFTHTSAPTVFDELGTPSTYHINKTKLAEEHGYRCIHIFDWDDVSKVVDSLQPKQSVNINDTEIYLLNTDVARTFIDRISINSYYSRSNSLCFGLVRNKEEIISMISIGKPRHNKCYDAEIYHILTDPRYRIDCGLAKLFSFITASYGIDNIVSYSDIAKDDPSIYEELPMRLSRYNPPKLWWSKGNKRMSSDSVYNKKITRDNMIKDGWLPVYDCGQRVYTFNSK